MRKEAKICLIKSFIIIKYRFRWIYLLSGSQILQLSLCIICRYEQSMCTSTVKSVSFRTCLLDYVVVHVNFFLLKENPKKLLINFSFFFSFCCWFISLSFLFSFFPLFPSYTCNLIFQLVNEISIKVLLIISQSNYYMTTLVISFSCIQKSFTSCDHQMSIRLSNPFHVKCSNTFMPLLTKGLFVSQIVLYKFHRRIPGLSLLSTRSTGILLKLKHWILV